MIYCYIRVSTDKQEYDRQINIFKEKGYIDGVNCQMLVETFTGKSNKRPILTNLIEKVIVPGDTLIVESLSRLSRAGVIKTLDLITYLIQDKKINVTIFKEGFNLQAATTPDSTTNLLLGIFSVLGQFERDIISERTKEGLRARANAGVKLGRKSDPNSCEEYYIKVLELLITEKEGQIKATRKLRVPTSNFKVWIKTQYQKYETKDYEELLKLIKRDKRDMEKAKINMEKDVDDLSLY